MIKTVREALNDVKIKFNLTNRKWAEISGVAEGTINNILSGRVENPSVTIIEQMLRPLGLTWNDIFNEPDTPEAIQAAAIDHYSMLIESYKDQLKHYDNRIIELNASFAAREQGYRDRISTQQRFLWALFIVLIVALVFLGYLCVDVLHGDWGIMQYPR